MKNLRRRFTLNEADIKTYLKNQAILDIIVVPEHESWRRLVSYQNDSEHDCERFKITTADGDHLYVLFTKKGVLLKGFDHDSYLSPFQNKQKSHAKVIYEQVPPELLHPLIEEEDLENVTFCLWKSKDETEWNKNKPVLNIQCQSEADELDDGEKHLLSYIFSNAEDWFDWASIYYELEEEAWDAAERLYESGEVTRPMVMDLNPDRDYDTIIDECETLGLIEE